MDLRFSELSFKFETEGLRVHACSCGCGIQELWFRDWVGVTDYLSLTRLVTLEPFMR